MNHHLFFVGLLSASLLLSACESDVPSGKESSPIRPAYVHVIAPEIQRTTHRFVGKIDAAQTVDLSFEVGGQILEIGPRSGETVTKGDVIAKLDPRNFELQLQAARARLAQAETDLRRKRSLLAEAAISQSFVDDAANVVQLRQAEFLQAEKALDDTQLIAPFTGHLAKRHLDNHMAIQAGQSLVRLNDLSELFIRISVPEKLLSTLDGTTTELSVTMSAAGGQRFPVYLKEYVGEANGIAQSFAVTLAMEPVPGLRLLPGMNATVIAERTTDKPSISVPVEALVTSPEGDFLVWVVDPETQRVSPRQVVVGLMAHQGVLITSGLSAGEVIVVAGAQHLRTGLKITPVAT